MVDWGLSLLQRQRMSARLRYRQRNVRARGGAFRTPAGSSPGAAVRSGLKAATDSRRFTTTNLWIATRKLLAMIYPRYRWVRWCALRAALY
jgi:hypothetical protein